MQNHIYENMRILSFGSLNTDNVYEVSHFVTPGETLYADNLKIIPGGKGLNQSISLAKGGLNVSHAGIVGKDGNLLIDTLNRNNIKTNLIKRSNTSLTGHTIIQVDNKGQNSIIYWSGANHDITADYIDYVLEGFSSGDYIILQNEINNIPYIIDLAHKKGLLIVFNPSPFNDVIQNCDISKVSYLFMNEIEASLLTKECDIKKQLEFMALNYPTCRTIITMGEQGSYYKDHDIEIHQNIVKANVVDTTAAGDTFAGFFIAAIIKGYTANSAMKIATTASSITVSRPGASDSIPSWGEISSVCG